MAMDMKHPSKIRKQTLTSTGDGEVYTIDDNGHQLLCMEVTDQLDRAGSTFICAPITDEKLEEFAAQDTVQVMDYYKHFKNANPGTVFYAHFSDGLRATNIDYLNGNRIDTVFQAMRPGDRDGQFRNTTQPTAPAHPNGYEPGMPGDYPLEFQTNGTPSPAELIEQREGEVQQHEVEEQPITLSGDSVEHVPAVDTSTVDTVVSQDVVEEEEPARGTSRKAKRN